MFEELYRNTGTILVYDNKYKDGQKVFKSLKVLYFVQEGNFRDQDGVLQLDTTIFCKAPDFGNLPKVPASSKFVDAAGEEYELQTVNRMFDHFKNAFECLKLVVKQ